MIEKPRGIIFSVVILIISGIILNVSGIVLIIFGWNVAPPPGWSADFVLLYATISIIVGTIEIISAYGLYKIEFWGWVITEFSLIVIIAALSENLAMFLIYVIIFVYLIYERKLFIKVEDTNS